MRSGAIAVLFLAAYGIAALAPFVPATTAYASTTDTAQNESETLKDWVCKYVGTPGVDEQLKNGNGGLVWVSTNATQGTWFNDAQGRSYVLLANAPHNPRPDSSLCPAPQGPQEVQIPATPKIDDPCGLHNASWVVPADTVSITWELKQNGHLVASTATGYKFTDGTTTHDYGVAPDSGKPCVKFVEAIPPYVDKDLCGKVNDTYTIPKVEGVQYFVDGKPVSPGTYSTNGALHIEITAKAQEGYVLVGDDCWKLTFTDESCLVKVTPVKPEKPAVVCGPANDEITLPKVTGVVYTAVWHGSWLVVTATPAEGYRFSHDAQTEWRFKDHSTRCSVEVPAPEDPTVVCGANNDILVLPEDVAHVTYTSTGWIDGKNVVTATTDEGYYISGTEGETTMQWTFKDDATLCAVTVAVPVDPTVVCGANNDVVTVPTSAHVTYTSTGWIDGKNTITATVDPGYYIAGTQGLTTQSWTYTDTNTSCGQVFGRFDHNTAGASGEHNARKHWNQYDAANASEHRSSWSGNHDCSAKWHAQKQIRVSCTTNVQSC